MGGSVGGGRGASERDSSLAGGDQGKFLIKNLHFPDSCQLVKVINFRTYCFIEGVITRTTTANRLNRTETEKPQNFKDIPG